MRTFLFLFSCFFLHFSAFSQDDLLELLDEQVEDTNKVKYAFATWKTTRLVNSRTTKLPSKGVLQFVIQHRFGKLNSGWRELFGIDDADMRLGLEYGVTKWLSLGFARSSVGGTYDGFARIKFLKQTYGSKKIPFTGVWLSGVGINSKARPDAIDMIHRFSYAHQLLVARKFTRDFSLQIMPTFVHLNLDQIPQKENILSSAGVEDSVVNIYRNDIWSVGIGARYLVSRSIGINVEYIQPFHKGMTDEDNIPVGSLAIGLDIETGGHVFQITFTNSRGLIEQIYLPDNEGWWWDGNFHIGFNINRVIPIVNYEKRKAKKSGQEGW